MPLPIENLDEWSYRELVQEGIRLLPSIAPEWTNYNPSDPGITLLELFAYFTEMLVFQTGQLTGRDLRAFLSLLEGSSNYQARDESSQENPEQAIGQSLLKLRQPGRAVTCEDFERFALLADPRVQRAKCQPRLNLSERNDAARSSQRPGHVSIAIVPRPGLSASDMQSLIENVRAYLEPRRILTTRVHVVRARYVAFKVQLKVVAVPGVAANEAAKKASEALRKFYDPIQGGRDGRGWPFGRDIFVSELYQLVSRLPTTNYVTRQQGLQNSREAEELVPSGATPERIQRNDSGELVALHLALDELPGAVDIQMAGQASALDQSRQI